MCNYLRCLAPARLRLGGLDQPREVRTTTEYHHADRGCQRLLEDITGAWKTRGTDAGLIVTVLSEANTATHYGDLNNPDAVTVTGKLNKILGWAAGRDTITNAPKAPAWI